MKTRQSITISASEEIAFINGWVGRDRLLKSVALYGKSPYDEHMKAVAEGKGEVLILTSDCRQSPAQKRRAFLLKKVR